MLASGALIASLLAVGTAPAGGDPAGLRVSRNQHVDHPAGTSACVGDALDDHMFTDVSEEHAFGDAINCIAYYGVTNGTGDGSTFSPNADVTRAQMAVFIARAAEAAGVDLGAAGSDEFGDIGDVWQEAQDAINQLASEGMIPSGGDFRPDDAITRAEMATFLVGLLVEGSDMVTKDPQTADRDEADRINLGLGGNRTDVRTSDWFADARTTVPSAVDTHISVLYELGVTRGAERTGQSVTPTHVLVTPSTHAYLGDVRLPTPAVVLPQKLSFDEEGTATFSIFGLPDREAHLYRDKSDVNLTVQHYSPAAPDRADVPLPLNYDPSGTVSRGQMAAFITRALDHTSVRPAGVSAQMITYDDVSHDDVLFTDVMVVSVRTEDFQPVSNAVVDLFSIDTPGLDLAFRADGSCREVGRVAGRWACEIDGTDRITGGAGDITVDEDLIVNNTVGTTVWAWTGEDEDTVEDGTELYRLDIPREAGREATQISVTTDHGGKKAHQDSHVVFTLQIQDIEGENLPSVHYSAELKFVDGDGDLSSTDSTAPAFIPGPDGDYRPFNVLSGEGEEADAVNSGDFTGVFSTEGSLVGGVEDITISVKPASKYVAADARGATSRVKVSVTDQYGDPITGVKVQLMTDRRALDTTTTDPDDYMNEIAGHKYLAVGRDGSYTFGYEREDRAADTDGLTGTLEFWDHDGDGCTALQIADDGDDPEDAANDGNGRAHRCNDDRNNDGQPDGTARVTQMGDGTIEWAAVATSDSNLSDGGTPRQIYKLDKETNTIFVGTADGDGDITENSAVMVSYDDNDRFNFTGDGAGDEAGAVSYSRFEQELSARAGHLLGWSIVVGGYRATGSFTLTIPEGS